MKNTALKSIIFFFILQAILNCNNKKQDWNETNFDSKLSQNDSIKLMNELYDSVEFYNDSISGNKKTSFVIYDNDYNKNICKVQKKNDTLDINIGYSSGFSSGGFIILYANRKYKIQPYYGTDNIAIFVDEKGKEIKPAPPKHFFKNPKLILDKPNYKKNDSIYGFIDFSSLEINDNKKTNHKGRGYFKAKIQ